MWGHRVSTEKQQHNQKHRKNTEKKQNTNIQSTLAWLVHFRCHCVPCLFPYCSFLLFACFFSVVCLFLCRFCFFVASILFLHEHVLVLLCLSVLFFLPWFFWFPPKCRIVMDCASWLYGLVCENLIVQAYDILKPFGWLFTNPAMVFHESWYGQFWRPWRLQTLSIPFLGYHMFDPYPSSIGAYLQS